MATVNVTNFQRPKPLQTKEKPFYLFISFLVFNFFLSSSSIKHTLHNIYTYFQWQNTKHTFFVDVCGSVSIRARHIRNNQQNRQQHNHCTGPFFLLFCTSKSDRNLCHARDYNNQNSISINGRDSFHSECYEEKNEERNLFVCHFYRKSNFWRWKFQIDSLQFRMPSFILLSEKHFDAKNPHSIWMI